ncbi:MAG: acyl-CoA synthetase [Proteobacteria bacterium]|nr:acyl-CoA synthetase [Pseudomonadota bacterium]
MDEIKIATMADIKEIEQVPFDERLKATNMYDLLKQGSEIDPEKVAMSFMLNGDLYDSPMEVTYKDFFSQINRTANLFHDLGVGPGDVVSYLLPNAPHAHYVLWGGEAAGVVNPINPLLEAHTIKDICQAANTKVLVALGEVPGSEIWPKVEQIRKELPNLKAIVRVFGSGDEKEGIIGYDEVIQNYNGDKLDSGRQIDPSDLASIYHTGGTTGIPKLAPHTHFNEASMAQIMDSTGLLKREQTVLCGLPLFHVNGTMVTGGYPFSVGAHVVILSPQGYRDAAVMQNFYKIVERYKANFFSCVPTVLSVLLDIEQRDADISTLKFALCGAAPLSTELINRFESKTNMTILEGYGLTEGTTASTLNPPYGKRKVGSIGFRLPYTEMTILTRDEKGLREAADDEIGQVCIKGPTVFSGYLDENKNKNIWVKDNWLDTGDLGRRDAEGYFWLTGRSKDLIIRGGHNIDPAAIEEPLYMLDDVQVAAAVGRPDRHAGEVPVAFVQLQQGSKLTAEKILEHLQENIGERAAIPKDVFIMEELPLTPIGKIFKPALRQNAVQFVYLNEIKALGGVIESLSVDVTEDKLLGTMANVRIKKSTNVSVSDLEKSIKEVLARYTIKYELTIT